jgi:hypothetical protein
MYASKYYEMSFEAAKRRIIFDLSLENQLKRGREIRS